MARLEDLQPNTVICGILPDCSVTLVSLQWFGSAAVEMTFKDPAGRVANRLLYREDEPTLEIVEAGRPWSFDGDGRLFRLVSEAQRIRLAHLFDPLLAVHTSLVEPLPHQITAVYEAMLPRQPLRYLLADDPGAGKTIMSGLLLKELIVRGDVQRCLIVCPGSLAEQWQDELDHRFNLPFEILTNDKLESARSGNWFLENNLVIARLDKLARNYWPLREDEPDVERLLALPECAWISRELEVEVQGYAVAQVVPEHLGEVRGHRQDLLDKTEAVVKDRLTKEINYWDHRAEALKLQEQAGKPNARLNSQEARKRADVLEARLRQRLEEVRLERQIAPLPPVVLGGVLVVPLGLVHRLSGIAGDGDMTDAADRLALAARAREVVMAVERRLGFEPIDREAEKLGYDIESRIPNTGRLRFIEVKGRVVGAATLTVTRNEILYSLNQPDNFILAIVVFDGDQVTPYYLQQPFRREPDFGVTSVNYSVAELLARAEIKAKG